MEVSLFCVWFYMYVVDLKIILIPSICNKVSQFQECLNRLTCKRMIGNYCYFKKVNPYAFITNMVAKIFLSQQTIRVVPKSLYMKSDNEAQLSQCVKTYPKSPKLGSNKLSQCCFNAFEKHWNDTSTIFLLVILQMWGFLTLYCDTDATYK